jgi:glycosyltransferase involved in cell wall biosynthesis
MDYRTVKEQLKQSKLAWVIKYIKRVLALKDGLFELKDRMTAKKWAEKTIVYFTGHTMYEWSPDSLKTGIGGSETAVINLVREWSKLGYSVTVYGNFGAKAGTYDGVNYRHYTEFNKYDTFDTLILWRRVDFINFSYKANRVWYDVHDVLYKDQFNEQNLKNIQTIFFKSQYQRNLLPQVSEDKFVIIPNGVKNSLAEIELTNKNPHKLIYASNYQRGLELMLIHGWPIIKREIPEAVLHIYYGWNFTDLMYGDKPEYQLWKSKMIELMNQPGIVEHGKVGQDVLIAAKINSVIHYYATNFEEMEPISLKESAIVGCLPVTTNYAALAEKDYCLRVSGDPNDPATQEAVAYKVVELLKNQTKLEELSQNSRQMAKMETWDKVAQRWIDQMKN